MAQTQTIQPLSCEYQRISQACSQGFSPHVPVGDVAAVHDDPLLLLRRGLLVVVEPQLVPVRHVSAVVEAGVGGEAATLLLLLLLLLLLHHLTRREGEGMNV